MPSRRNLMLTSLVVVSAFSLLAAACGGSPRSVANTTPGGELEHYADCMRSHGVSNFPGQASFGSSTAIRSAKGQMAQISQTEASTPKFQAAQRACAKYYGPGTPTQGVSAQEIRELLAVSHCMRAHGIANFPDPNPITGHLSSGTGIDQQSSQVIAALHACSSLARAAGLQPPRVGN